MMSPGFMNAVSVSIRWRSEPQMFVLVTSMIASVGSGIVGSGTSETSTLRLPCQVTARMTLLHCRPAKRADVRQHHGLSRRRTKFGLRLSGYPRLRSSKRDARSDAVVAGFVAGTDGQLLDP